MRICARVLLALLVVLVLGVGSTVQAQAFVQTTSSKGSAEIRVPGDTARAVVLGAGCTTTADAASYVYDVPAIARVEAHESKAIEAGIALLSDTQERSVSSPVEPTRTSTTPPAIVVATEAGPIGEIGPAGNPGAIAGKTPPLADHHLFPQQFRAQFERAGVNIDEFTVTVDRTTHLRGLHGNGLPDLGMPGKWNQRWAEFFDANPSATGEGHLPVRWLADGRVRAERPLDSPLRQVGVYRPQ